MTMNYVYSAETNLFYPLSLRTDYEINEDWPENFIEVSDEMFTEFTSFREGKIRVSGPDGLPVWEDVPPPSKEKLAEMAEQQKTTLRAKADAEIAWRQDAVDAGMATEDEITGLAAWKKYRVLLMRVDTSKAPDINWPEQY